MDSVVHFLKYILFPLKAFYWIFIHIRNFLYHYEFFSVRKINCKVVSVGNLTIGGTGKTPCVIYIALLLKTLGKRVAILSRGYGRKTSGLLLVSGGDGKVLCSWEDSGDEPYMMAKKLPDVPILVDENRYRGGVSLVNNFNPEVILLDDGFQHRSIYRDLDIVLVDGTIKYKEYQLLPYGTLREPWKSITRADTIMFTKGKPDSIIKQKVDETALPVLYTNFIPKARFVDNVSKEKGKDKNVFIFSGVGNPEFFIKTVKNLGYNICGIKNFPDHYHYKERNLLDIERMAEICGASLIVTTEKDWIKVQDFKSNIPFGVIDIDLKIENTEIFKSLIKTIC